MLKLKNSAMLVVAALCGYLALMTPDWKGQLVAAGSQAYVSDFNKDGTDDLLFRNIVTSQNQVWEMDANLQQTVHTLPTNTLATDVVALIDADSDFDEDILWYNPGTTDMLFWRMENGNRQGNNFISKTFGATLDAVGDFDGDGDTDILLKTAVGDVKVWTIQSMGLVLSTNIGTPGGTYQVIDVGDFTGDGIDDIVMQDATGAVRVWELNATATLQQTIDVAIIDPAYALKKAGDFDKDGDDDMMFRNDTTGQSIVWRMESGARQEAITISGLNYWMEVQLVVDFDQDGDEDIMFRDSTLGANEPGKNSDGHTIVWVIEDGDKAANSFLGTLNYNYRLEAAADTDGDLDFDLVYRRPSSGLVRIWQMNGSLLEALVTPGVEPTPEIDWELRF